MPNTRETLYFLIQDSAANGWFPNNAEVLKLADYLIANGATVQQWIEAEEQPPEKYKKVLVKDRITGEVTTAYWGDFDCFVFEDGRGHGADLWMPLPQ